MRPITKFFMCDTSEKVTFTEKELKELVEEIYNQGVEDGKGKNNLTPSSSYTAPASSDQVWPPLRPAITCDNEVDWSKISITSTPQTGNYTTTANLYSTSTTPTITNSATIDWARTNLTNKK